MTLRENRAAFERILLRPRVLVDVSQRDLTTTVLGTRIPFPLMLAPTAYQRLSHPEGEVETARGAGALGVPMILSTLATRTLEDVAAAATGPLWFQLYMMDDMRVNEWLVRRAEANGYGAIVFTVDLVVTGNREGEKRTGKAVALGARAVCIGRPYVWGLAAKGAVGVQRVLRWNTAREILQSEFDMALILLGRRSAAELDGSVIWRRGIGT